jgi:hypothetical protein
MEYTIYRQIGRYLTVSPAKNKKTVLNNQGIPVYKGKKPYELIIELLLNYV